MPENIDLLALGQTLGQLTQAINSNVEATKENTRALSEVQIRLAKGDGEIFGLKKEVAGLACKALAASCPAQTAQIPPPAPALVKIAPEGWTVSLSALSGLLARHWRGAAAGSALASVCYALWAWCKAAMHAFAQHPPAN